MGDRIAERETWERVRTRGNGIIKFFFDLFYLRNRILFISLNIFQFFKTNGLFERKKKCGILKVKSYLIEKSTWSVNHS